MKYLGKYLTTHDLADRWNVKPQTLSAWRMTGKGPTFHKFEGSVRYLLEEIESYESIHQKNI